MLTNGLAVVPARFEPQQGLAEASAPARSAVWPLALYPLLQSVSQIVVRLGEIGLDPQRLLVVPDGIRHPARLRQSDPQVVVRLGVIGLDPQRLLVVADGFRQPCPLAARAFPRL